MNGKLARWGALGGLGVLAGTALLASRERAPHQVGRGGPSVVILGAGFAGLTAARTLARELRPDEATITLVDRNNYHLFTPLLFQIATCGVDPWHTAQPVREIVRGSGIVFRQSRVRDIDLAARRVQLDDGTLAYDYLLIALGSTTSFFHETSAREHALALKTIPEALAIRERILAACERAATLPDGDERRKLLTFVVVGGGATGTELTASLADLLYHVLPPQYPQLDFGQARLMMVESEPRPIPTLTPRLGQAALARLRRQGVEVWLKTKAREIGADSVTLDDGRTIATATPIWATGVRASEVAAKLDTSHGKGGAITVNAYLQLAGHPNVYAAGDNAAVSLPGDQHAPLLAWAANQAGTAAARNIVRALRDEQPAPFQLHSLGSAVSLGRNHGAAQVGPVAVEGFAGWLAWRAIHLAKISTFRSKLGLALDWSYAYTFHRDTARLPVGG